MDNKDMLKSINILKYILEALNFLEKGDLNKAIECLDKALLLDSNNTLALLLKGTILRAMGNVKEALECFEKLNVLSKDLVSLTNLICLSFMAGEYEKSIKCIEELSKIMPTSYFCPFHKAFICIETGDFEGALNAFDEMISIGLGTSHAFRNKAILLHSMGRIPEAIECIDKTIENNPKDGYAWYLKGKWLKEIGKYKEALKCLYVAVEINKNWIHIYKDIGHIELIMGNCQDALEYINKYLEKYSNDLEALFYKGIIYERLNKLEDALKIYDKIIKSKRLNFVTFLSMLHKARVLEKLGRINEALEIYNEVFSIELTPKKQ